VDKDTAGTAKGGGSRNIRLLLEYDGLPFHGWQVQPVSPTVQEVLQEVIGRITGETRVVLRGSGRTDAGVHALGQVANFHTGSTLSAATFTKAINSLAPPGLAVLAAQEVPAAFDAQYSAKSKVYRYRVLLSSCRSPLRAGRLWHVPYPLREARMRLAARHFVGRQDFSSFRSSGCTARSPVRTLRSLTLRRRQDVLAMELEADGFLRHMVRNIVGTLVDVGRGRIPPSCIPDILAARDRSRAGTTAPAHGLFLVAVRYPGFPSWRSRC
jgi:tRNA pseudouridine38-40 synthase